VALDQARLATYDLDDTDRSILALLDEGHHISKVARILEVNKSTVSRRVSHLEDMGAVQKQGPAVPGNPTIYEVDEAVKARLKRKEVWGHNRSPERLSIVIQKAERVFSVLQSEGSGVARNTRSGLHCRVSELSQGEREELPGRYGGEVDHGNWMGYRFFFRGWVLEVTTRKVRARPVGGLEVSVSEAERSEWPVSEAEERGAEKARYVVESWASGTASKLLTPVNPRDLGWLYEDRHYALKGLDSEENKKLKQVQGFLKLPEDVEGRVFVDKSPPGEDREAETADPLTAEFAMKSMVEGARSSSMVEQLVMDVRELKSEVSRNGSSKEDLKEIKERQEALAGSVRELVGMLKASGGSSQSQGPPPDGPMFG